MAQEEERKEVEGNSSLEFALNPLQTQQSGGKGLGQRPDGQKAPIARQGLPGRQILEAQSDFVERAVAANDRSCDPRQAVTVQCALQQSCRLSSVAPFCLGNGRKEEEEEGAAERRASGHRG